MRCKHLRTIVPVCFVAVVFLGVVRRRHVHSRLTAKVANGVGDFGCRAEALEEINLDAVGRENVGNGLGEEPSVVAAVVSHHHTEVVAPCESFVDVVGKTLRRHSHDIDIHAVGTGTHDATQSTRSELKVAIERINQFGLVTIVKHCLHGFSRCFVKRWLKPLFCSCLTLGNQLFVILHNLLFLIIKVFSVFKVLRVLKEGP